MKILVTGTAGFIGYHLVNRIAGEYDEIVGIDNLNDYYDVELKYARLADAGVDARDTGVGMPVKSTKFKNYTFYRIDLDDRDMLGKIFSEYRFERVCHLAAQAGVRYSIDNPYAYLHSNISGFLNILELCRHNAVKHLVYASSSSVYGLNSRMPFSTTDNVDHPVSLYAASKKSNELMAHTYAYLFGLPSTGLRFFTVYGPWGRPDMAYYSFTDAIVNGRTIDVYNNGMMERDFTYIDDITEGVARVIAREPRGEPLWDSAHPDPGSSKAPYKIYNIGNSRPVKLLKFIEIIESRLGRKASKNFLPMQPGDVVATYADVTDLVNDTGYKPVTGIETGIGKFVDWFMKYHQS